MDHWMHLYYPLINWMSMTFQLMMHSATGSINENDILLAKAADAIVIGFRVQVTTDAKSK